MKGEKTMFYYAEINGDYLVINTHSLNTSSTNANYVAITEEQYTSGNVIGKYYNSLTGDFEILAELDCMGGSNNVSHKDAERPLSTVIDNMQVEIDSKADANHTHTEFASSDDLALLEDMIDTKANATHTHTEYALSAHTHDNYATVTAFDALESELDGKANANHTHDNYASVSHAHTASEVGAAASGHNHDNDYADINHNHDSAYAIIGHDHDDDYATIDHAHTDYATQTALSELSATVSGKANTSHTHDDRYYTETEINTKLADKSNVSHTHTGVYDVNGAAANALTSANAYTDSEIETLSETVGTKANTSDLTSHTGNTTVHITSTERNNWNAAKTHANSAHAPSNAEENQNAFSNVVVGSTTISADKKTDTLTLVAGNNVTITPDATGDSITISSANTVYTHPTSAGNKHIPAGGSSGQILRWSADGTAVWGNDNNTTYSNATQTTSGLMSDTDKTKLDGIAEGANKYVLPSAGTSLGGVKTGGDVTISSGVITVNDDSHNHIISNVDGLQSALDSKAASGHDHNSVYYTETEVDTLLTGKANTNHTHTIANITNLQSTLDGKANASHGTHVSYSTTAPVMDGTASVGTASTVARSDHKHPVDTSRAAKTSLDSHTSNKSNPHGVTLAQLGVTATAAELNKMDGVTATTTELNYIDGVTSNIQTQLNGKEPLYAWNATIKGQTWSRICLINPAINTVGYSFILSVGFTRGSVVGQATFLITASHAGSNYCNIVQLSANNYTSFKIRGVCNQNAVCYIELYDNANSIATTTSQSVNCRLLPVLPLTFTSYTDFTTGATIPSGYIAYEHTVTINGAIAAKTFVGNLSGNASTATKLSSAKTISLTGDVTGSTSFDGSGNVSITATVADDSHNHTIANIDNLQTTLDGKASSSHTHSADALIQMADALFGTNSAGGVEYSYGSGSGKNVLTEISNMPQGFHTVYSIAGTTGNPETSESYRYLIHKTSTTIGWIWAFGADGSIYSNYLAGANTFKGWKTIHDAKRKPLWTGSYYMTAGHTATPSKKLSQCEHGWMLLWSDYDPDTATVNNTDFCTTMIPNRNWAGDTWNGAAYYCDIPRYTAGTATDSESRIIKVLNVYDNKLVGTANNNAAPRNDVILRAVYEF